MSEYRQQDSVYEIEGTINGPVTLGHVDVLIRYMRRSLSGDDAQIETMLKRLKRVDDRVIAMAMGHADMKIIFDSIIFKAAMGAIELSKERREWIKMGMIRCGQTVNRNQPGSSKEHNVIISVKPLPHVEGATAWIDPKDGTLPPSMKKGVPILDPAAGDVH